MGIARGAVYLLFRAREQGVNFGRVLTLGSQNVLVSWSELAAVASTFGVVVHPGESATPTAQDVFAALGAGAVESLDASPYEDA